MSTNSRKDWEAYWEGKPLKDPRYHGGERRRIVDVDEGRLQSVVGREESAVFRDAADGSLVFVVLRGVVPAAHAGPLPREMARTRVWTWWLGGATTGARTRAGCAPSATRADRATTRAFAWPPRTPGRRPP